MRYINIKTKITDCFDYADQDFSEKFPKFDADGEKLENDIRRIRYAHGRRFEADTVEKGDVILLSCSSSLQHFHKEDIYVIVGKNLFSDELESKLVGLRKGETLLTIENEEVKVIIKSILRTEIPELSDENVRNWGIEGISTEDELRRYCFDRQVDDFRDDSEEADMAFSMICMEILNKSSFEYDKSELAALERSVGAQVATAKEASPESEETCETDFDELAEMMIEQSIKAAALGYKSALEEGKIITDEDYSTAVRKRAIALGLSVDETKAIFSETDYALEYYAELYFHKLDRYIGDAMKQFYYERFLNRIDVYDVAIVGAGPAGLSAALTLNLHKKTIIWFGTDALSDKIEKSEKIANYAGFEPLSGKELNERFRNQIKTCGLSLTDRMVTKISRSKDVFSVVAGNDIFKAKTVLLSIGSVPSKGIENEAALLGHGVSYCATCDGFLYEGKTIAVYCGSKRYEHEVAYLAEISDKVYLSAGYKDIDIDLPNVELLGKPMKAVIGNDKVSGILLADGTEIQVDGAFFLRSAVAPSSVLNGLELNGAHIVVDRSCKTNIEGCFAAGDCTGRPYQIAKAVGEGNIAAHSIVKYLSN